MIKIFLENLLLYQQNQSLAFRQFYLYLMLTASLILINFLLQMKETWRQHHKNVIAANLNPPGLPPQPQAQGNKGAWRSTRPWSDSTTASTPPPTPTCQRSTWPIWTSQGPRLTFLTMVSLWLHITPLIAGERSANIRKTRMRGEFQNITTK